ncbi:hypothetical protein P153DRAFT_367090 [Dothidotthia symphoricarpi CBS 119687]|uniref:Uncharacterized protein n=1 Tax=Dothidotthia symphoricarpi CBS 119687 TaxID=1392245 RepID=A0A6A6A9Y0_9PLEO|nr:uncharacterized protein P153DRAFT_367090 [Dothidotthia symphoricarpi CBS 119687]KAF2128732.1 hypothetical protein P153DRAFT_367090 [Dothidotthia symphoricarpi CBS 119687]
MSRTTRLASVEFRPLLQAPIRVPLRALQSLNRPQCRPSLPHATSPQCLAQRRFLNLYLTAKAKTVLGMHKVLNFDIYDMPELSASEHRVNVVKSEKDSTVIAADISMQELYDNHVKPGHMLYLTNELSKKTAENFQKLKDENIPSVARDYALVEAKTQRVIIKNPQSGAQLGELKRIHMTLSSPTSYYKLCLDRAYQFIESGSPIEVHIRVKGSYIGKDRFNPGPADVWPWMHSHFPHLRPDIIHKAMPSGTIFLVEPVCDGKQIEFVLSKRAGVMPKMDLTQRLFKVKSAVIQAIQGNANIQVPPEVRVQVQAMPRDDSVGLAAADSGRRWAKKDGIDTRQGERRVVKESVYKDKKAAGRGKVKKYGRKSGDGNRDQSKQWTMGDRGQERSPLWLRRSDAESL